jgi:nucleoside-diphosphate-sugar epimerase
MTAGTNVPKRRLVIGCGYLGMRVAEIWQANSGTIFALSRSRSRADGFARKRWSPLLGDICGQLPEWPEVDTVLLSVGFDRSSGHSIEDVYVAGMQRVIDSLPDSVSRLIYISSTGVYGSPDDDWLDESSECRPDRPGGMACLEAEKRLASSRFGDRLLVLRLSGIYGPQRIPRLASLSSGDPIEADPEAYVNLIHVDDAARVTVALEQHAMPALFCVTDGNPCRRREFISLAAAELDLPAPQFVIPSPQHSPSSRAETAPGNKPGPNRHKRIRNDRLLATLPQAIQFSSYRDGLPDAIRRTAFNTNELRAVLKRRSE